MQALGQREGELVAAQAQAEQLQLQLNALGLESARWAGLLQQPLFLKGQHIYHGDALHRDPASVRDLLSATDRLLTAAAAVKRPQS